MAIKIEFWTGDVTPSEALQIIEVLKGIAASRVGALASDGHPASPVSPAAAQEPQVTEPTTIAAPESPAIKVGIAPGGPGEAGIPVVLHREPPATVAAPESPDLDSAGTPWDKRIHTDGRTVKADGTWRRRRGCFDAVYTRVMAEINPSLFPAPEPPPAPPATPVPPPPATPVPPPPPPANPAPAPPATPVPPPPATPVSGPGVDFVQIMRRIKDLDLSKSQLERVLGDCGVASIPALVSASAETRDAVYAALEGYMS